MTLAVDLSAVTGYARQLRRATEDAEAVTSYVSKHSGRHTGGELIEIAGEGHDRACAEFDATFGRLINLLDSSALELDRTAGYYRRTDLAAADAVDRALPSVADRCAAPLEYEVASLTCPPAAFADPRQVTDRLTVPPAPGNPSQGMAWMGWLSPTSWATQAMQAVFGFNPVAWLQERLAGDWEALATMRPVLVNAGDALHDLALNIQSGATTLGSRWQGNAGDAAYRYFTDLATAITALETPLDRISAAYRVMADAVWSTCEVLGGIVAGLVDAAIIAGIAAAAGAVTAGTGVGPLVAYGVAAAEVAEMLLLWGKATSLYQKARTAVLAFRAVLDRELSDLGGVRLPRLPGGAGYDHPLVSPGGRDG
jgi:uncharacterized protein YukE